MTLASSWPDLGHPVARAWLSPAGAWDRPPSHRPDWPRRRPLRGRLRPGLGSLLFVRADIDTRPVGPKDVTDLARLFESQRTTRGCWCMAFCVTRSQFAAGWLNGGNQRRFGTLAAASSTPMGILASQAAEPVGWCPCGTRSRYVAPLGSNAPIDRRFQAGQLAGLRQPCGRPPSSLTSLPTRPARRSAAAQSINRRMLRPSS